MPDTLGEYNHYSGSAINHINSVLHFVDKRRVAVQAGGHAGQFPAALAVQFDMTYTWEPDPINYAYLIHNLSVLGLPSKVYTARGLLGSVSGTGAVTNDRSGGNKRLFNIPGPCPVYRVDDLNLPVCDLIYLDTEGSELDILKGAVATITRCQPVIACEEKAKFVTVGDLAAFLSTYNYKQVGSYCNDIFFQCLT